MTTLAVRCHGGARSSPARRPGIGAAIADALARDGTDLVLVGRDIDALGQVADRARAHGVAAEAFADLRIDDDLARLVALVSTAEPLIDLLVNNAGVGKGGAFAEPAQAARQILDAARRRRRVAFTGSSPDWVLRLAARAPGFTESTPGRGLRRLRGALIDRRAKRRG
jgi:NAD(P)-dependent dehydrogenase (short-subunit alcohol dehydrogenase family)